MKGPVSIAVEADKSVFQSYRSGVMTGMCGTQLDHGILLVGYGTESGTDYWKVKNSWGTVWGIQGFGNLERGKGSEGECGILMGATYPVVKSSTSDVELTTCTGSGDPKATSACYEGAAGALGLKEHVKVDVKSFASSNGVMDLSGSGIESFTCKDHKFTKSGQEIKVDVTDCVPSAITVSDVKYCSDSDQIKVTVKDKAVPLPISAILSKVDCAKSNLSWPWPAKCEGSGDPTTGSCYEGEKGALGKDETIKIALKKYANGAGSMDLSGSGAAGFTCKDHSFTKSGQNIKVDLADCLPKGVELRTLQYCSKADTISVTIHDIVSVSAVLKKVACPTETVVV